MHPHADWQRLFESMRNSAEVIATQLQLFLTSARAPYQNPPQEGEQPTRLAGSVAEGWRVACGTLADLHAGMHRAAEQAREGHALYGVERPVHPPIPYRVFLWAPPTLDLKPQDRDTLRGVLKDLVQQARSRGIVVVIGDAPLAQNPVHELIPSRTPYEVLVPTPPYPVPAAWIDLEHAELARVHRKTTLANAWRLEPFTPFSPGPNQTADERLKMHQDFLAYAARRCNDAVFVSDGSVESRDSIKQFRRCNPFCPVTVLGPEGVKRLESPTAPF